MSSCLILVVFCYLPMSVLNVSLLLASILHKVVHSGPSLGAFSSGFQATDVKGRFNLIFSWPANSWQTRNSCCFIGRNHILDKLGTPSETLGSFRALFEPVLCKIFSGKSIIS
jgi:hypothetical protein